MAHKAIVKLGWTRDLEDGDESYFTLTCLVVTPEREITDRWEAPDYGEVDVIEVREDETGKPRPDLLLEAQEGVDMAAAMELAEHADDYHRI